MHTINPHQIQVLLQLPQEDVRRVGRGREKRGGGGAEWGGAFPGNGR